MIDHSEKIVETLREINKQPKRYFQPRDYRMPDAIWPAHNSQDLPDTDWYVKDPS